MSGGVVEGKEHKDGEENRAAWLVGIKTLKIEPYHLPPLGKIIFSSCAMFLCPGHGFLSLVFQKTVLCMLKIMKLQNFLFF